MKKLTLKPIPDGMKVHALTGYKYTDSDSDLSKRGKVVEFWNKKGFHQFYKDFRKPNLKLKENFFSTEPYDTLINFYQWKGIEFGNWTSNEDRYNYLLALILCSHDLNEVLKFKNNIGLFHVIHIAFGARGQGKALAHFEPDTFAINLTRYKRADKSGIEEKQTRFFLTGGIGSLAHEYGHALDYFFGRYVEKTKGISLSGGDSINTKFYPEDLKGNSLHTQMNKIIQACIWNKKGEWTTYYKKLRAAHAKNEYWYRHNEIWARLFEQYIQYKLQKKKIHNTFLAKKKYEDSRYLPLNEFKAIVPKIDLLMRSMAKTTTRTNLTTG